jgi:hypothetical protein
MNLPEKVEGIEVFYDGRCGMCCSFHEWINRQPRAFRIDFIPYQAPHAEQVFPGLGTLDPAREMVVRTSDERIFRGAEAWVWCLYSCTNHQIGRAGIASGCDPCVPGAGGEPPRAQQGVLPQQGPESARGTAPDGNDGV